MNYKLKHHNRLFNHFITYLLSFFSFEFADAICFLFSVFSYNIYINSIYIYKLNRFLNHFIAYLY